MSQPSQAALAPPPPQISDRKVAMKDNAGIKHRVAGDKVTRAVARGRASTGTQSDLLAVAPTDLPPAESIADSTVDPTPTEEPNAGEKRVRSGSVSSLSALSAAETTVAGAGDLDGPEALAIDPVTPTRAQDADLPLPAPTEGLAVTSDAMPASPDLGGTQTTAQDPPSTQPIRPQTPDSPTYRRPRREGEATPAHRLEPLGHVFHHDTPAIYPNPNRVTDVTLERLHVLRTQRIRKCDPQTALVNIVPTPRHGWPRIYPAAPDFLYANLPDATLDKWLTADGKGEKVIVQVMRQNSWCAPQCDTTANLLVRTIEGIFGAEKVRVATASEDVRGRSQQNAPFSFLVFGLTAEVAAKLLDRHCFATELIQFLAYPLIYAATPCFLGSLGGLRNIGDDPSEIAFLQEDIVELMLDNRRMYQAILAYAQDVAALAGDSIMDPIDAANRVLSKLSLGVLDTKSSGGIEEPTINIFLELPASYELDRAFPILVDAAKRITFDTAYMGTGRFFAGFACHNCRGTTHPTGMCSFEYVPEWEAITRPDRVEPSGPSSSSQPTAPAPSPRTAGPTPRRDAHPGSSKLAAPSFRAAKGHTNGRD